MNDELKYPLTRPIVAGVSRAGPAVPKFNEAEWMAAQLETLAFPPRNCGGVDAKGNLPSEDGQLLSKTAHVRRKGERLMQLIARIGISPAQIRDWDKKRIASFCEQAQCNAASDFVRAPASSVPTQASTTRPVAGCTAILVG